MGSFKKDEVNCRPWVGMIQNKIFTCAAQGEMQENHSHQLCQVKLIVFPLDFPLVQNLVQTISGHSYVGKKAPGIAQDLTEG